MYYILNQDVTITGWKGGPYYYKVKDFRDVHILQKDYELLKECDGMHEIAEDNRTARLYQRLELISPCEKGSVKLLSGQVNDHPYIKLREMDWTITDRCNHNCLHCFHAVDNGIQREEFSYEEAMDFLDQAKACGINGIRLTGGEPTLYPYFREVVDGIYQRGMRIIELITNGSKLDDEMLEFLKAHDPNMEIMLSFDGIGFHDWFRQVKGSEKMVLDTIKRCKEKGFTVFINMNANRRNRDVIFDSVKLLYSLGVDRIRIIKTTEAPRWVLNAGDATFTLEEYYDFAMDFMKRYLESGMDIIISIWQTVMVEPKNHTFYITTVKHTSSLHDMNKPICIAARHEKPSMQSNGDLVPCAPFAGYYRKHGLKMDNIKERPLAEILSEGFFCKAITYTVKEKLSSNAKCSSCRFAKACLGGCTALSYLFRGGLLEPDITKCFFFENGYYEKFACLFDKSWINGTPLPEGLAL